MLCCDYFSGDLSPLEVIFTTPPDLTVTNIIAPAAITSGNKIDLTWTVLNQGAGGTVTVEFDVINQGTASTNIPNWTDRVYLSLHERV